MIEEANLPVFMARKGADIVTVVTPLRQPTGMSEAQAAERLRALQSQPASSHRLAACSWHSNTWKRKGNYPLVRQGDNYHK